MPTDACRPAGLDLDLGRQELRIRWSDGLEAVYPATFLRSRCPCAACRTDREKQGRTLLPILSGVQSKPAQAVGGHTVGHYALALEWSDGHNTGIYDFRFLRELAGELQRNGNRTVPEPRTKG
jgi:DUF971 family protein